MLGVRDRRPGAHLGADRRHLDGADAGRHTAEDLCAMGLPQPGELYREEQPDGTILIRQHSPSELKKTEPKNKFICD